MTNEEVSDACKKFCDYLQSNGRRPVALVMLLCNDRDNTECLVSIGLAEMIEQASLAMLAYHRGFTLNPR